MSVDNNEAEEEMSRCASCGKPENDDIKLRKCTACYLVRYCGVKCQQNHKSEHEEACKERAAKLRETALLFKQPESSHLGDCPICSLPLPHDKKDSYLLYPCCSKTICAGCRFANIKRQIEGGLQQECPFCRHPAPASQVEADRIHMKRVEANDPVALREFGTQRYDEGDYKGAFEYWTKAAELGDVEAHYQLSCLYHNGEGVDKDEKKKVYHLEQAAIGGHPTSRHSLGCREWNNGRYKRAAKHFIVAASLGHDDSLKKLKISYQKGRVSKDYFATTLRAHHAAVNAMKSPLREAAEADVEYVHL